MLIKIFEIHSIFRLQAFRLGQIGQGTSTTNPPCLSFKGEYRQRKFKIFTISLQTPSAPSIPSPSSSVVAKKELGRRESERESEEKKKRTGGGSLGEKQESEENRNSKRSDSQLSRNPSDSSSSKNASSSTGSVHSTNLGKPAPNLSFVARPEKPTVVEEKVKGNKEEEKKAVEGGSGVVGGHPGVVGSNIGWNPEVLRGRASGAERVESTNEEYTNGTEAKESQQVTFFTLFWIHDSQPNIFPDSFHLHSSVKSPHMI